MSTLRTLGALSGSAYPRLAKGAAEALERLVLEVRRRAVLCILCLTVVHLRPGARHDLDFDGYYERRHSMEGHPDTLESLRIRSVFSLYKSV